MYVCICNSLKEKQVKAAVQRGADTVGRVFKAHGCKSQCGQCTCLMRDTISDEISQFPAYEMPLAAE